MGLLPVGRLVVPLEAAPTAAAAARFRTTEVPEEPVRALAALANQREGDFPEDWSLTAAPAEVVALVEDLKAATHRVSLRALTQALKKAFRPVLVLQFPERHPTLFQAPLEEECFRRALLKTAWDKFEVVVLEEVLPGLPAPPLAARTQGPQEACQKSYLQEQGHALKMAFRLASIKRVQ